MADPGITIHLPPDGGAPTLEGSMDPTIALAMNQNFSVVSAGLQQAGLRHVSDSTQISTDASRIFQHTTQLVGAKAAGQLDRDDLAMKTLWTRAAAGQPQLDSAQVK